MPKLTLDINTFKALATIHLAIFNFVPVYTQQFLNFRTVNLHRPPSFKNIFHSQNMTTTSSEVPYFVLHLSDGKAKALFTVPTQMAESLVVNPVMCRGSSFDLEIDVVSQGRKKSSSATSFLSTEFYSPDPEETAQAISERIAIRMGSPSPALSQFFGFR